MACKDRLSYNAGTTEVDMMKKHTWITVLIVLLGIYHVSTMLFDFPIPTEVHMALLAAFLIGILYLQCEDLRFSNHKEDYTWKQY